MISGCTCGHISCVCQIQRVHKPDCAFRRAATCSVPVECEHGYDVCPACDKCMCFDSSTTNEAYEHAMKTI